MNLKKTKEVEKLQFVEFKKFNMKCEIERMEIIYTFYFFAFLRKMIKKLLTFCYWSDPAVFRKAEEGGFWVSFPDFPECMTQGDSMNEAYEMAVDALGLSLSSMEDEGTAFPKASELDAVDSEDGVLVIVEFDMAEYRRKNGSKAVKKTLSIPEWLNRLHRCESWLTAAG